MKKFLCFVYILLSGLAYAQSPLTFTTDGVFELRSFRILPEELDNYTTEGNVSLPIGNSLRQRIDIELSYSLNENIELGTEIRLTNTDPNFSVSTSPTSLIVNGTTISFIIPRGVYARWIDDSSSLLLGSYDIVFSPLTIMGLDPDTITDPRVTACSG